MSALDLQRPVPTRDDPDTQGGRPDTKGDDADELGGDDDLDPAGPTELRDAVHG